MEEGEVWSTRDNPVIDYERKQVFSDPWTQTGSCGSGTSEAFTPYLVQLQRALSLCVPGEDPLKYRRHVTKHTPGPKQFTAFNPGCILLMSIYDILCRYYGMLVTLGQMTREFIAQRGSWVMESFFIIYSNR